MNSPVKESDLIQPSYKEPGFRTPEKRRQNYSDLTKSLPRREVLVNQKCGKDFTCRNTSCNEERQRLQLENQDLGTELRKKDVLLQIEREINESLRIEILQLEDFLKQKQILVEAKDSISRSFQANYSMVLADHKRALEQIAILKQKLNAEITNSAFIENYETPKRPNHIENVQRANFSLSTPVKVPRPSSLSSIDTNTPFSHINFGQYSPVKSKSTQPPPFATDNSKNYSPSRESSILNDIYVQIENLVSERKRLPNRDEEHIEAIDKQISQLLRESTRLKIAIRHRI